MPPQAARISERWRLTRIPEMLPAAGLSEITVEPYIDRVYSFNCGASSAQLEKIAESHAEEIGAQHHLAGGEGGS